VKKTIALFLISTLIVLSLAGCGFQTGLNIVREIPLPDSYTPENVSAPPEDAPPQASASPSPVQNEGSLKSLEEIKDRAKAAGYETEELLDFQSSMAEGSSGGFNVVIGDSHIPVMAFETPEDAQIYADAINEAGYNIAIVNGRYLTMASAHKGKIEDPEEQAALEKLMDAKAQVDSAGK
jgi:hypothetical protein